MSIYLLFGVLPLVVSLSVAGGVWLCVKALSYRAENEDNWPQG